jgi:hypothetical protein
MITAIVQFSLPKPLSLEEAARGFESTAPKYQVFLTTAARRSASIDRIIDGRG